MDLTTGILQALLVIITYETGHYGSEALFDDIPDHEDQSDEAMEGVPHEAGDLDEGDRICKHDSCCVRAPGLCQLRALQSI